MIGISARVTQKVPYSLSVSSQYIFLLSSDQTSALIVLSANITDAPSYYFPLKFFSDKYFSFWVQSCNICHFPKKYFVFFPPEYFPLFPQHIYFLIKIHLVNFDDFVVKTWKSSTFGGHQANWRSGGHCSIGCREFLSKLYCCTQILSESRNNFKQLVWQVFLLIKSKTVQFAYNITELNNCIELKHQIKILFVRFLHPVSTT